MTQKENDQILPLNQSFLTQELKKIQQFKANTLSQAKTPSIDQKPIQIKSQDEYKLQKSIINFIILCLSIIVITSLGILIQQDLECQNINEQLYPTNSKRNLQKAPITKIISKDDVPRWFSYYDQDGLQEKNQQEATLQQNTYKVDSQEVLRIVFDNDVQLDYQIIANITAKKKKVAEKLLNLNQHQHNDAKFIYDFERNYYDQAYQINKFDEKSFCLIVPTYNNAQNQRYKSNLQSIIKQEYNNFKVVIIDDHSEDQTGQLIETLLQQRTLDRNKYILIKNDVRRQAMSNIRMSARKYCGEKDIMIIVDGDDQLIGRQVLKLFNSIFHKPQIWFAYSNFIDYQSKNIGFSRQFPAETIANNNYRRQLFYTSHLRAFYVKLFLSINQKDLKSSSGNYFEAANDVAMCIPMLEMSHTRIQYIPEVTCGYNSNTGSNNHFLKKQLQKENDKEIRRKRQYQPLKTLFHD